LFHKRQKKITPDKGRFSNRGATLIPWGLSSSRTLNWNYLCVPSSDNGALPSTLRGSLH